MTVPAPTDFFPNLTIAPFTAFGGPAVVSDQHGTDNTFDFDGVNDRLSSSVQPLGLNSGNVHSYSVWVFLKPGFSGTKVALAQWDANNDSSFELALFSTNGLIVADWNTGGTTNQNNAVSSSGAVSNNAWARVTCTINGTVTTNTKIYVNGVEVSYLVRTKTGSGFTDITTTNNLQVASLFDSIQTDFFEGIVSRPTFWEGIELSAAEVLEEYNNEVALIPGASNDEYYYYYG